MNFVLDSSLTLAFFLEDEATPNVDEILDRLGQGTRAFVPALWRWEVSSALLVAERRKRIDQADAQRHLNQLKSLPIEVDNGATNQVWTATHLLAQKHNLSNYDAAYLEMAIRRAVPLGSLDSRLRTAAKREIIALLPLALGLQPTGAPCPRGGKHGFRPIFYYGALDNSAGLFGTDRCRLRHRT